MGLELLYLDQVMAAQKWKNGTEEEQQMRLARDEAVRKVFSLRSDDIPASYFMDAIPNVPFGLCCAGWEDRRGALLALRDLMRDWVDAPSLICSASDFSIESSILDLEACIARYYCQSFWVAFGRAPIIPHHLAYMSLTRRCPASFLPS